MNAITKRLEKVERVAEVLDALVPKIENIHSFVVHVQPLLATKADIATTKNEIVSDLGGKIDARLKTSTASFIAVMAVAVLTLVAAVLAIPEERLSWAHGNQPASANVQAAPRPTPPAPLNQK